MASSYHGNTVSDQLNQNPNASNNANSNVLMTTSLIENVKTIDTATTQIDSVNSPKLTVSHQSSQETNSKNGKCTLFQCYLFITVSLLEIDTYRFSSISTFQVIISRGADCFIDVEHQQPISSSFKNGTGA